ncbi:jg11123 [Pararge aegeria aegeria]|uniref:Jg11123 protein n=1 Tax=Pararge aegeria aegeria TaxID=348720 RepID=A0A8S4RIP9_9NEOP|nr:jg11123 [Pararge aegeria aegeria]
MSKSVAFLFVLAISQSLVTGNDYVPVDFVENIDNQEAWQSRIVSGWEARPGQHPHQASLRMVNPQGTVSGCGGSVVARQWVITSAHCTASRVTIVVRAGVVSLTRPEAIVESTQYYNHPTFDSSRPNVVQPNDIALVQLPIRLQYTRNLQPIRIQPSADARRNYEELVVYASGFGRTWTNGPTTEVLRWVYLRGVSNPSCASVFGTRVITDTTMCARFFNVTSQSVCQGDSGGPLVHVNERGVPILVGVSSFVAGEPFGCHSGMPSGFARPGPFHAWYQFITGLDFENLNEEEDTTTETPPATTVPTLTTPNTTLPTTTTPNITNPTTTTPNITIPTTTNPNITNPTTTTPNITIPTTATPNITNPTTTTPNITSPTTTSTPNITIPTTISPNITTTTPTPTVTTTTTVSPPTSTPKPEDNDEDDDEEDPELSELLKRLEVKVKVMVRLSKLGRKTQQIA